MTTDATPGEPATGTETPDTDQTDTTSPPDAGTDWKAEFEKIQKNSRKWEERAKANADAAKELDELRKSSMTDLERAAAEAKAQGRAEAFAEVAVDRVADAVRAAATGRNVDVDALLEGINASRFIDDSGVPNRTEITAWLDKVAPATPVDPNAITVPDLGQGGRGQPLALNGDPLENALRTAVGAPR